MPGLPECLHCPLRDSELVCPTIARRHPFCERVTPGSPTYHPRMAASVVMIAKGEKQEPAPQLITLAPLQYPPPLEQAKNAFGAAVQFVASGCAVVDREEATRRLDICKACEFFDAVPERCSKCSCQMAIKTYGKAFKCPVGKW